MDLRDAVLLELDNLKGGSLEDHPINRLRSLFAGNWESDIPDVAVLLRQILMAKSLSEDNKAAAFFYDVKTITNFDWRLYGLNEVLSDGRIMITLLYPNQSYLQSNCEWFEYKKERSDRRQEKDPFFYQDYYMHQGQREAINVLANMSDGATSVIQLPTGSGKSTLFTLPLFWTGSSKELSIVVVPTVSLALDQERRIKENELIPTSISHPLAWHGDLSEDGKEEIKRRIKDGSQRIVFLNPETLSLSLMNSVVEAAKKGFLKYLFVDEAHIIGEWGEQFRPDFQALGPIKRLLLKYNPALKTILLSATVNKVTAELLSDIFSNGAHDQVNFGSFNFMREEPKYYSYQVEESDKLNAVIEIFKHTPRPAIFYATKIRDVNKLYDEISGSGHKAVAKFTGNTMPQERQRIIEQWSDGLIDVVIANAAFGVGLDKSNVRAVVHYSVPETFDRYYQETGRSGRDGFSSYAISVFSSEDIGVSREMLRENSMGEEKAWERWKDLIDKSREIKVPGIEQQARLLDLGSRRLNINQESPRNVQWNHHVVRILERCNLIRQHILSYEEFDNVFGCKPNDQEGFWKSYDENILCEILDSSYMNEDRIKAAYKDQDPKLRNSKKRSQDLLVDVLSGKMPMENALTSVYQFNSFKITQYCRGCRAKETEVVDNGFPPSFQFLGSYKPRNEAYEDLYNRSNGYIFYDDDFLTYFNICIKDIIRSCKVTKIILSNKVDAGIVNIINKVLTELKNSAIFIDKVKIESISLTDLPSEQSSFLFIFERGREKLPEAFIGIAPAITLVHENIKSGIIDKKLSLVLNKTMSLKTYYMEKSA